MSLPYVLCRSFGSNNTDLKYSKMVKGRHCHMFLGSFGSRNTHVKYSEITNGHHCHVFSGGVSEVEIHMLSTVKSQMGITAMCSLVEFRR